MGLFNDFLGGLQQPFQNLGYTAQQNPDATPLQLARSQMQGYVGTGAIRGLVAPAYASEGNYAYPYVNPNTTTTTATIPYGPKNPGPSYGGSSAYRAPSGPIGPSPAPQGPSQEQILQDRIRSQIGGGFDSYIGSLDQQMGLLPQHYDDLSAQINNLYGGQKSTIDTSRAQTDAQLASDTQNVGTQQKKSLRTLGEDFSSSLDAANNRLGTYGASDSSAKDMYSYALGLQANKNRGNLQEQANQLYSTINLKKTQLQAGYKDQINQLDTWKNTELSNLGTWLQDQKNKLISARGLAQQQKSQALAQLDQSALGRLQQLDDQFTQYKQGLSDWALNHGKSLNQVLSQLQGGAKTQVNPFAYNGMDATIRGGPQTGTGSDIYGYYPQGKRDQFGNPIG